MIHFIIISRDKSVSTPNCHQGGTPRARGLEISWNSTLFLFWSISFKKNATGRRFLLLAAWFRRWTKYIQACTSGTTYSLMLWRVSLNVFCVTNLWKPWIPHKWCDYPLNMKSYKIYIYILSMYHQNVHCTSRANVLFFSQSEKNCITKRLPSFITPIFRSLDLRKTWWARGPSFSRRPVWNWCTVLIFVGWVVVR